MDHVETGLLEAEPQSAYAGEDIHYGRADHDSTLKKRTRRIIGMGVATSRYCISLQNHWQGWSQGRLDPVRVLVEWLETQRRV